MHTRGASPGEITGPRVLYMYTAVEGAGFEQTNAPGHFFIKCLRVVELFYKVGKLRFVLTRDFKALSAYTTVHLTPNA